MTMNKARLTRVSLEKQTEVETETVGLSAEEQHRLRVEQRKAAFRRLEAALVAFEAAIAAGTVVPTMTPDGVKYRQWEAVQAGYHALRRLYVTRRSTSGWVANPAALTDEKAPRTIPDPVPLDRWATERSRFQDAFYGVEEADGKRRFRDVPPEIADVIKRFKAHWSTWHKKSDRYKAKHKAYMRTYMAKRRAEAKAKKGATTP